MLIKIVRKVVHLIFPMRYILNKYLKSISMNYQNLDILEIGSGDPKKKQSSKNIFLTSKSFIQTDININYGYEFLDITSDILRTKKYDLVICTNVLEHIFELNQAIQNLKLLLKTKGHLLISVPFIYPLHDEPSDYWRFTEHALKKMLIDFKILNFKKSGLNQFPIQYILLLENS